MAADMQWATREQVDTLTAAQAQDRERISRLEVRVGEQLATKEDVASFREVMASVKTDLRWIKALMGLVGTGIIALLADLVFRWLG